MNETQAFRVLAIKSLAIVGFLVTLAFLVWLGVEGARRVPETFSSLASLAESMREYRPAPKELSLATEKSVVNSGESFQISWTDMKRDGEYAVRYTCTDGVTLTVRGADGALVPMQCTETLTLPKEVQGLFLTIESETMRLTDVPISVTWKDDAGDTTSETRVTVANAMIPAGETEPTPEEPAVTETPETPAPAPAVASAYPASNPNGYTDLAIVTLGSGVIRNGIFTFTPKYDRDLKNAVKFDVKNVGTKTSGPWTFTTVLPSGQVYESAVQMALGPMEHIEFTMGFDLNTDDDLVKVSHTVKTQGDVNAKNNSTVWYVVVQD